MYGCLRIRKHIRKRQKTFPDARTHRIQFVQIVKLRASRQLEKSFAPRLLSPDSCRKKIIVQPVDLILFHAAEPASQESHHGFIAEITVYNFKSRTDKLRKRME